MTTKEWLNQYRVLFNIAVRCLEACDAQRAKILQSPAMTGLPRGGGERDLSDVIAQMERLQKRAERARRKYLQTAELIETAIDAVEDPTEASLLRMRYILGLSWGDIADGLHVSTRTVYRIHGNALQHVKIGTP